ncbi:GrpB family protein [Myroides sp. LJL115]
MKQVADLGLEKGKVELLEHSQGWKQYARETIIELKEIFGHCALDIQHIGSTAIPGIKAKPIIDIVVGVKTLSDVAGFREKLEEKNYIYRPLSDRDEFFIKDSVPQKIRTHHIHIIAYKSQLWNNYINFRDYLNANPEQAKLYQRLKEALQTTHANNRVEYTKAKEKFILDIFKKIKK